jgi:hypothetical protein
MLPAICNVVRGLRHPLRTNDTKIRRCRSNSMLTVCFHVGPIMDYVMYLVEYSKQLPRCTVLS